VSQIKKAILCYNIAVVTEHFLKTLIVFMGMITLGLVGIFLVSYFDGYNEGGVEAGVSETPRN